ncbi:TIGR04255 family protein [Paraferrimonas sp. SM1919]|uniref:TIGR04255 family protein n=1 Tax=Paraferrimonas sp. SM1919 TaxID=2662263 RepID=UPI0013CFB7EB|nr:TIGR04255 family protein [Paraferrimonas sp. SM1919]
MNKAIEFKYAPLIMTLTKISFSNIPDFKNESLLAELEKVLRELGYVEKITETEQEIGFEFNSNESDFSQPIPKINKPEKVRYIFRNLERNTSIYLSSGEIFFKTTAYTTHVDFVKLIGKAIKALINVYPSVQDGAFTAIGTRYVNLIVPKGDSDLSEYVKPEWYPSILLDVPTLEDEGAHTQIMMNYITGEGGLTIQSLKFSPKMTDKNLPIILPELADSKETSLIIRSQAWWDEKLNAKSDYLILDFDLVKKERKLFNLDDIIESLNNMRKVTKAAFVNCITEKAQIDWEVVK